MINDDNPIPGVDERVRFGPNWRVQNSHNSPEILKIPVLVESLMMVILLDGSTVRDDWVCAEASDEGDDKIVAIIITITVLIIDDTTEGNIFFFYAEQRTDKKRKDKKKKHLVKYCDDE